MQWECVVFSNGVIEEPWPNRDLWNGKYSVAHARGSMIQYLKTEFERLWKETATPFLCVIPCTDGDLNRNHLAAYIERSKRDGQILILGTLGQTVEDTVEDSNGIKDIRYLYLPLDDHFFDHGLGDFLANAERNPWSNRISKAVWRGGCSGGCSSVEASRETARIRTVAALNDAPDIADVKLCWWWSENKGIPSEHFGSRMEVEEMLKYKLMLIIDGNVIASSHMWSFASGAVPILISNARCWFSDFLVPYVNYIPVTYDLSDLQEKIRDVLAHDDDAKELASRAMEFTRTHFSPEFQRRYLTESISRLLSNP
jgi:hypothetical protein